MPVPKFIRDSAHLWLLLVLLIGGGIGFLLVRAQLVPASYGEQGAYRANALQDIASRPSHWHSDATCLSCHEKVAEERKGSLHEAVRCFHCHGAGAEHVKQATLAKQKPGTEIPKALAWDGNFLTKIDLFITKDKATCLSCHQSAVGMPADFKKIDLAKHLEEQGASEPNSPEVCSECHAGHNTAP